MNTPSHKALAQQWRKEAATLRNGALSAPALASVDMIIRADQLDRCATELSKLNPPSSIHHLRNPRGITVAQLKELLKGWPDTNHMGEPCEAWIMAGPGASSLWSFLG